MAPTTPGDLLSAKDIGAVLPLCEVHHLDITCDGCGAEPIVGKRFKCQLCRDVDLCEQCLRSLMAARISIQQEFGGDLQPSTSGRRGSNWISRVKGNDPKRKWQALMETVPCLHRSHSFEHVRSGPERAIVFRSTETGNECSEENGGTLDANMRALEVFLECLPPSKVMCTDAGWLHCVYGETSNYTDEDTERRIENAIESWDRLVERTKGKVAVSNVDSLAKKHNLMSGKWLFFPENGKEVDQAWGACTRTMLRQGGLGPCSEIKVSTHSPNGADNKHVMLAYVRDYTNDYDVASAANAIKDALSGCGVTLADPRLLFKADST